MMSFYKSAAFVVRNVERFVLEAEDSLGDLHTAIEKEISDLLRFKQKVDGQDVYLYADRIKRRREILEELYKVKERVVFIGESNTAFMEFCNYLKGEKNFIEVGGSGDFVDLIRYFYRETVKKYKLSYGMTSKKMYKSDAYALCVICAGICEKLSPVYSYLFVDEGQDISLCEYDLLRKINKKAAFNIFGDVAQNVTPWRGIRNWLEAFPDFELYGLNQNYRNTNQIVDYVAEKLHLDMQSIGYDGPAVTHISQKGINAFFKEKKGLKAVICSEKVKAEYVRKSYNDIGEKGKVSRSKINIMSVYESKGLEFTSVVVIDKGMSDAEKYIAYTRALNELAIIKE